RSAAPGCGALLLLRAPQRPHKRQTAAPALLRLFRPQDAPQLRSQRRLAASSTGRASPPLPWGQNLAPNRALGLRPRTLSPENFPVGVQTVRTCRPVWTDWNENIIGRRFLC